MSDEAGAGGRLQRLVAHEEIRDLALRYAVAVDGKDLDALASLFVPDVDNGRFGPGPDGVRSFYDQALRKFHCSMHLVANQLIDIEDADHAHGIMYCLPITTFSSPSMVRRGARLLGRLRTGRWRVAVPPAARPLVVSGSTQDTQILAALG